MGDHREKLRVTSLQSRLVRTNESERERERRGREKLGAHEC